MRKDKCYLAGSAECLSTPLTLLRQSSSENAGQLDLRSSRANELRRSTGRSISAKRNVSRVGQAHADNPHVTCDAFGRLIARRVDDDGNGTFDRGQSFVYDGLDIVLVFDDAGSLENRFLHGPAVDQVLATEDGSGDVLWPLADNQGTIRDLADYDAGTDATSVVNHLKYDSFGNVTAESNASASPMMKFTGRYYDEDVGLQWNWQRWYDPQTGLWLSEDPLGFAAGDANLVRYVVNSPANGTDPSGVRAESTVPEYGWELPLTRSPTPRPSRSWPT